MVGPKDVIEAVQNLMCKHHPALFEMADMSKLCRVQSCVQVEGRGIWVRVMVFNATFNNISVM
jgi:hypothetical protein